MLLECGAVELRFNTGKSARQEKTCNQIESNNNKKMNNNFLNDKDENKRSS